MTSEQRNKIHRKQPGKSDEDNWFEIYRILFPQADLPNSPCNLALVQRFCTKADLLIPDVDSRASTVISNFLAYFRVEAPRLLGATLNSELGSQNDDTSDAERSAILNRAVDQCIEHVLGTSTDLLSRADHSQGPSQSGSSLPGLESGSSPASNSPLPPAFEGGGLTRAPDMSTVQSLALCTSIPQLQESGSGEDPSCAPALSPLFPEDFDIDALFNHQDFSGMGELPS